MPRAAPLGPDPVLIVVRLAVAVIAVPLFRRLGLGSVLGYLAAGLAVGPFASRIIEQPEAIPPVAEPGVVAFSCFSSDARCSPPASGRCGGTSSGRASCR